MAQVTGFDVTVVFSEAVTGFVQSELVVTGTSGASITAWNPQEYNGVEPANRRHRL
jgi:hypothetical protein